MSGMTFGALWCGAAFVGLAVWHLVLAARLRPPVHRDKRHGPPNLDEIGDADWIKRAGS